MEKQKKRDFLSLLDLEPGELSTLLLRAEEFRKIRRDKDRPLPLLGKSLAMVFEKASTRTRVSFEIGVAELGGTAVYLGTQGSQLGRGEPAKDTARVLSRYCDGILLRTFSQTRADTFAKFGSVPVLNGLTDLFHPCQIAADLLTCKQEFGKLDDLTFAWVGDGNNMAHSWINAAAILGLDLRLACPEGYKPNRQVWDNAQKLISERKKGSIEVMGDPAAAVANAHVISTDVWASMGQEEESNARQIAFKGYTIDSQMLTNTHKNSIVLHCLPAYREEEISAEVLEGKRSRVWQQAENRLHVQKALLELFMADVPR